MCLGSKGLFRGPRFLGLPVEQQGKRLQAQKGPGPEAFKTPLVQLRHIMAQKSLTEKCQCLQGLGAV